MYDGNIREVLGDELHGGVDGEEVGGVVLRPHVVRRQIACHIAVVERYSALDTGTVTLSIACRA